MIKPARFISLLGAALLVMCAAPNSYAQDGSTSGATPSYARVQPINIQTVVPFNPNTILDLSGNSTNASTTSTNGPSTNAATTNTGSGRGNIAGLDTVPTFSGAFFAQAGPSSTGTTLFRFTMMGNDPLAGGTTTIPAKITEVSLQLLNSDGSTFKVVPYAPFEDIVEDSPNFEKARYNSSPHKTQFVDAEQRAQFFNSMKEDWHTLLSETQIVNRVTIQIPRFVNIQLSNGTVIQARSYFTGTAADGSTFVLLLNILFSSLFFNQAVADINGSNYTTDAFNYQLYPNTYLFSLNANNPNVPGGCCVLGFHTYFFDPGTVPQPRWVFAFASFISPGLFGAGFQDVTAISHETSEAFNDPFVNNATPTWQFPGQPATSKMCQANLETGDPVEVLPAATVPIFLRERRETFIYHPQTEALLQWFEMGATSNAIDGAFSYPDETTLPKSAVPCPQ